MKKCIGKPVEEGPEDSMPFSPVITDSLTGISQNALHFGFDESLIT